MSAGVWEAVGTLDVAVPASAAAWAMEPKTKPAAVDCAESLEPGGVLVEAAPEWPGRLPGGKGTMRAGDTGVSGIWVRLGCGSGSAALAAPPPPPGGGTN